MSYTVTAKRISLPSYPQTPLIQATVTGNGYWELRILVGGTSATQSPWAYGWLPSTLAIGVPQVSYGDKLVSAFSYPATFDGNGNVLTLKAVAIQASFFDVAGGTPITTSTAPVN